MKKLLAIISVIQKSGGKRRLEKFFSSLALIFSLLIITALTISATLICILIYAHMSLLNNGVSAIIAFLIICTTTLLIITLLISLIKKQIMGLNKSNNDSPLMDIFDAFVSGLMKEK